MEGVRTRRIQVYSNIQDIEYGAKLLLSELTDPKRPDHLRYLGFDEEYSQISNKNGARPHKYNMRVAVIQFATDDVAHIFHVHHHYMLPPSLHNLLTSDRFVRIGYATINDVEFTRDTFEINTRVLDLQLYVTLFGGYGWGLADSVEKFCGYYLDKNVGDKRDWSTLDEKKISYAAADAFACVDLWKSISAATQPPSPLILPRPIFVDKPSTKGIYIPPGVSVVEKEYSGDDDKIMSWLQSVPPAASETALYNKLLSSYGPWSKIPSSMKNQLALTTAKRIWPLIMSNTTNPSSSLNNNTITKDVKPTGSDMAKAHHHLKTLHGPEAIRKRDRIINQLYNSLGILACDPCNQREKQLYVEKMVTTMIDRGMLKLHNNYELSVIH
jgi:hypothetical protein